MSETHKFWTNQLTAHGWASWVTGYVISLLAMVDCYFTFKVDNFWQELPIFFYNTGFLNALFLLLLTPVYVPIFGWVFRSTTTTPPLWLFIWLGVVLEYAITISIGSDFKSIVSGKVPLAPYQPTFALIAGALYGFLVHRTMDAKLNPSTEKSIPMWHKTLMMRLSSTFFESVLPAVAVAIVAFLIFTPVSMTELLSEFSPTRILMKFVALSALITIVFLAMLLPYYLVLNLFERFIPKTYKGHTPAIYGVFILLGVAHLTLILNIMDPRWSMVASLTEGLNIIVNSPEFTMLVLTWVLVTSCIIAYLYTRLLANQLNKT